MDLYHSNTKMFETRSGSTAILNGDLILDSDSHKLKLGLGADLNIYHNGSHSFIDNDTGTLYLQTATNISLMTNNNEDAIICIANGAVSLYHDNVKMLETLSYGIKVTERALYLGPNSNSWSGNTTDPKFEHHVNTLYIVGGTSGIMFRENATDRWYIDGSGHFLPASNNQYDIGSTSKRVKNIYTQDLQLSNEAKKDEGGNDVDGTWGNYTIQEGESDLFLINNRSGKKYKFNLTEVS